MKKILTIILILILSTNISWAKHEKEHFLNFNGTKFRLLYSSKSADFGGYLNEYFKYGDTYNVWSEMIAVHHFPNAYSPIDQIKALRDYLGSMNCPSALTYNDKDNTAMIDFVMINSEPLPIVLEFNVFKYEKSEKCGSIALQYAKRYSAKTAFELEAAKMDFEKNRKKLLNKIKNYEIPKIITEEIDKCKSAYEPKKEDPQIPEQEVVEENIVPVSDTKTLEQAEPETEEEIKIVSEENEVIEIKEENSTEEVKPVAIPEPAAEQPDKNEINVSDKVTTETKEDIKKESVILEEVKLDTEGVNEINKEEQKVEKPAKEEKAEKGKEEKQKIEKTEKQKVEEAKEEKQKAEKIEEKQKTEKQAKQKKENVKKTKIEKPKKAKKVSAKKRAKDAALRLEE